MKKIRIIVALLAIMLTAVCAVTFASCTKEEIITGIQSAEITKGGEVVKLKATLDEETLADVAEESIYLLTLPMGKTSLADAEVLAEKNAKEKLTFEFSLCNDNGDSRLTNSFFLAVKTNGAYAAITDEFYISDVSKLSQKNDAPNLVNGIKGLVATDIYGAYMLGAEHTVINASIDRLMLSECDRGAVRFNHEGVTYFFDAEEVESIDKLVADADRVGMRVYIRTTLGKSDDSKIISDIYYSGAKKASGYLPNVSNKTAARYTKAFYAFLASRYPVCDYIIGENVNNISEYCNAGSTEIDAFVKAYVSWFRVADLTLKSVNSSSIVYVSVDDYWRIDESNKRLGTRSFLEKLNEEVKRCGDFNYAVAINIGNGEDLSDLLAGKEYDYARIGASNLTDFVELFEKDAMYYNGARRRLIIDGLTLSPDVSEANKAAYYTYAYYTAAECGIEAFILSNDITGTGAERYDTYYAFLMSGTNKSSQLTTYTERLANARLPKFSDYTTLDLFYTQKTQTDLDAKILDKVNKYKPTLENFATGGATTNLQGVINEKPDGVNIRSWIIESDASLGTGAVTLSDIPAKDFIKSAYVGITVLSKTAPKLALVITNDNREKVNVQFVGEVQLSNGEATYFFNVTDFVKSVKESDTLTLSLCILDDKSGEQSVEIKDVSLLGDSKAGSSTVIVIIIVIAVVVLFIALIVLLAMKRKKKRSAKGKSNKTPHGSDKD